MKKIILIASLLMAGGVWAEDDEFPIQLTCDLHHFIIYIDIVSESEATFRLHPQTDFVPQRRAKFDARYVYTNEKLKNKDTKFREVEVKKSLIRLRYVQGLNNYVSDLLINRFNGNISENRANGKCHKGFKEYKDREF